jgi:DNA-binding CsgD family transcriptional regulator
MALKVKRLRENRGRKIIRTTKATLKQIGAAVDPRVVGGAVAGMTAGQVAGGVVGGVFGAAVAGPAGAVIGAEVGAFTSGLVGLKVGADAVHGRLEKKRARQASQPQASGEAEPTSPAGQADKASVDGVLQRKTGERVGEFVGLSSGASVGLIIAGPAGGLVGAVLGEALGGQVGEDVARSKFTKKAGLPQKPKESVPRWLDRFGKNTLGESASVLVAGSVGAVFGPSGRMVGQRVGLIFGKQVEWYKLGQGPEDGAQPSEQLLSQPLLPDGSPGPNGAAQTGSRFHGQVPSGTAEPSSSVRSLPAVRLTQRELEVLILLAEELESQEIAERLDISPATVYYHKRNIYQKLGVNDQREAAYVAVELFPHLANE